VLIFQKASVAWTSGIHICDARTIDGTTMWNMDVM